MRLSWSLGSAAAAARSRIALLLLATPPAEMDATTTTSTTTPEAAAAAFELLQLPNACLLAVLQCLAAADTNHRSLFSAARAHSGLHAAAAEALSALQARVSRQQQADGALLYLARHGQHVTSVRFRGFCPVVQLPNQCSQLCSLSFFQARVQLGPSAWQ